MGRAREHQSAGGPPPLPAASLPHFLVYGAQGSWVHRQKRHLNYWQAFNDWWRSELAVKGRKVNAAEIEVWYNEHAMQVGCMRAQQQHRGRGGTDTARGGH